MFSNLTIAFLAGVGFSAWVYSKIMRSTGGNTTNSVVVAGGAGLVLFLVVITFLQIVFN
jgi:hypothetical protein